MLCKILLQYSQYSFFGGILKTFGVTPFSAICKSRLNLLPYSASHNSTIIADEFIKFAGHLVYSFIHSGYLYSAPSRNLLKGTLSPAMDGSKRNVLRSLQKEDTLFRGSKRSVRGSSFKWRGQ